MSQVEVIKLDHTEKVMVSYTGKVLRRGEHFVVLEAFFSREDMPFMGIVLKKGDRFVETFFTDRWYNIFEIYDRDDGSFKGWYCNVGRPAVFEAGKISYVDLAIDLWVDPNGAQTVLDEDEFMALPLDENTRSRVLSALEKLQLGFENKKPPV
jgi:predicted RNA-binding protein associated with RNAse of E/G family